MRMLEARQRLERLNARCDELNARNAELKEQLDARAAERKALVDVHAAQMRQVAASHEAELSAFDTETETLQARRAEVKADYGLLYESAGELRKTVDAVEAMTAVEISEPDDTETDAE